MTAPDPVTVEEHLEAMLEQQAQREPRPLDDLGLAPGVQRAEAQLEQHRREALQAAHGIPEAKAAWEGLPLNRAGRREAARRAARRARRTL